MTKLEIIRREENHKGSVMLYPEGTFYKAYEQSAFILCSLVNPFKVSFHELKGLSGPYVTVGFPISSLEKWTATAVFKKNLPDGVLVKYPGDVDLSGFEEWKLQQKTEQQGKPVKKARLPEDVYPVYPATYSFLIEITKLSANLDKKYKYSLGEELRLSVMRCLLNITAASVPPGQSDSLSKAAWEMEETQLCLRILNDLKVIGDLRFIGFMDTTNEIMKQIKKWQRAVQE
ncbi:MAG: four helix bundle protein [Bacteroidales bacterium]|nr:four helix bundle protein [Bacteroidales bacterium]